MVWVPPEIINSGDSMSNDPEEDNPLFVLSFLSNAKRGFAASGMYFMLAVLKVDPPISKKLILDDILEVCKEPIPSWDLLSLKINLLSAFKVPSPTAVVILLTSSLAIDVPPLPKPSAWAEADMNWGSMYEAVGNITFSKDISASSLHV